MPKVVRWLTVVLLAVSSLKASGAPTTTAPGADIVHRAMQLLADECAACHNPKKIKGGLILMTREGALQGGDDGEVLVPGRAADSHIFTALAADAEPHMPPKRQLTAEQIELVRAWINAGAAWDEKVLLAH